MEVTIITVPSCGQCTIAKKLLLKKGFEFNEIIHDEPYHDDYPIIYIDSERFCYRDFLLYMKEY